MRTSCPPERRRLGMNDSPITATMLSGWLRGSGALPSGAVAGVRVELETETTTSMLRCLTVSYSPDAPNDSPRHLVVKSPLTGSSVPKISNSELQFYRVLAPALGTPPLVRCYATIADGDG